jgi:hypothetical protein
MRSGLKAVTIILLVLSLGLHWALLQTMAWTGMLFTYSRDATFRTAIVKTFDGQHPCSLCNAVKSGRAEQKKQDQPQANSSVKLDPGLLWDDFDLILPPLPQKFPQPIPLAHSRSEAPPKPRPRTGALPFRLTGA